MPSYIYEGTPTRDEQRQATNALVRGRTLVLHRGTLSVLHDPEGNVRVIIATANDAFFELRDDSYWRIRNLRSWPSLAKPDIRTR